jgi:hypothetical protein
MLDFCQDLLELVWPFAQDIMLPRWSYDLSGDQSPRAVSRRDSQIHSNDPTAGPKDVRQVVFNIAGQSGFIDLSLL